ncbi:condensation domain-containing protein [Streptomyces olivoreticuli]
MARRFELWLAGFVEELSGVERTYLTPSDVDHMVRPDSLDELQSDREIDGVYLANSLQQGFIYLALTQNRTDDAYIVQMMWSYATEIDPRLPREAWFAAQRTYPSLRLRFGWQDDLVQVIDAKGTVDWRYHDLSHESADCRAESLNGVREGDLAEPYDPAAAHCSVSIWCGWGTATAPVCFSHHHSILDG